MSFRADARNLTFGAWIKQSVLCDQPACRRSLTSVRDDTRSDACVMSLCLVRAELFFELGFALVQCLQTQLPAMQLNAELIDVTGDLGSLRFVFGQLALNFVCVSQRVRARLFWHRNSR